ncbi:hypothetical protein ZHAS_00012455 [Anopheles sinensis]|uniref:Uncharacterized protein n=1 Tax=Anopheles sinensis TaxID=74873 RepID=A0A084W2X9_ANOSI|nr:hypothetical protein ZHAS_00012455 [Anopheles sinensis]
MAKPNRNASAGQSWRGTGAPWKGFSGVKPRTSDAVLSLSCLISEVISWKFQNLTKWFFQC